MKRTSTHAVSLSVEQDFGLKFINRENQINGDPHGIPDSFNCLINRKNSLGQFFPKFCLRISKQTLWVICGRRNIARSGENYDSKFSASI